MAVAGHAQEGLLETDQPWWQLVFIQLSGMMSIPVLTSSILILRNQNFVSAVLTVVVGNILLWIIRYGILRISHADRSSALDLTFKHLGQLGGYVIAVALLADTLAWFVVQTTVSSGALVSLLGLSGTPGTDRFLQVAVFIGVASSLFCVEGMRSLKLLVTVAFPILILAFVGVAVLAPPVRIDLSWGAPSLGGLGLILGANLGVSVDLPTFFRHSRSWKDSFAALGCIQVGSLAIGIGALFLSSLISPQGGASIEQFRALGLTLQILLVVFVLLSVVSSNVSSVYSSSIGWELIAPRNLVGRKEYLILGLGLTTICILTFNLLSLEIFLRVVDSAMVNLCLIFFFVFIIGFLKGKPIHGRGHIVCLFGWLIATALNIGQVIRGTLVLESTVLLSLIVVGITMMLSYSVSFLGKDQS